MHGTGRTLLVAAIGLLFAFVVDWTLHVPSGVRLVELALLLGVTSWVAWRELFTRLARVPGEEGLAVLVERAHPELHELLVSAIELHRRGDSPDGADPELVARVIEDAEHLAGTLAPERASDATPSRRALLVGALGAAAAVVGLLVQSEAAGVFLRRIAGLGPDWPQRTFLQVEIPLDGRTLESRDRLALSIARGRDLAVVVRALGVVPEEVELAFEDGPGALLGRAGPDLFRTLLRSVQEDTTFTVRGGDDTDGTPRVEITVLQPPDVAGVAVRIEPPAYSGLPERTELDSDVQVLEGSKVTVHVLPDPRDAVGIARLLPEDVEVPLVFATYPIALDGAGSEPGLRFDLVAEQSLRYRLELRDSTGLSNPDPGLFAIGVEKDRPPEVELIAPARGEVETVIGGSLLLKARVHDDFGVKELEWSSRFAGDPDAKVLAERLEPRPLTEEERSASRRDRAALFASRLIAVPELFGESEPAEGEVFEVLVQASDNREPEAQEGRSAPVRIRVISADELLRRVQDRLSRVRQKVDALATLLHEKQGDTRDLIASLESDEPDAADVTAIGAALSGARRVQGDAQAITRELASITEGLVLSGLDDRAGAMLDALAARLLPIADRGFHAEPWLELTALTSEGRLGQADFADKLLEILGVSLAISEQDAAGAVEGLRGAQDERDITAAYDTLVHVSELQSGAAAKLEALLTLLSEWDNYQSVLSSARDLLNRQKNLLDRTREYYKEN